MPCLIRDRDGSIIGRSRNLAGIRKYVGGRSAPIIKILDVSHVGQWDGMLSIMFEDGTSFQTEFASYSVMVDFVRRWRNVHGAPLTIDGASAGVVSKTNPA
jgi:hypothetical protein